MSAERHVTHVHVAKHSSLGVQQRLFTLVTVYYSTLTLPLQQLQLQQQQQLQQFWWCVLRGR